MDKIDDIRVIEEFVLWLEEDQKPNFMLPRNDRNNWLDKKLKEYKEIIFKKKINKGQKDREDIIGIIEGTEISQIRCRESQNILDAKVEDEIYIYVIDAPAVLRMANEFRFNVVQKNKRKYLVPVEKFENGAYVNMDK